MQCHRIRLSEENPLAIKRIAAKSYLAKHGLQPIPPSQPPVILDNWKAAQAMRKQYGSAQK